jgi:hypothetical protein
MLNFDNSAQFAKGKETQLIFRNLWEPEDGFIWSNGKWCEIVFDFRGSLQQTNFKSDLIIDIDAYRDSENSSGQNVLVYLNGLRIGSSHLTSRATIIFALDTHILKPTENVLTLDTPDSDSPARHGGRDTRVLGVKIFSLQIRKTV